MICAQFDVMLLGCKPDLFIVGVYMPHHDSVYFDAHSWALLTSFLGSLDAADDPTVILAGDINARIRALTPILHDASSASRVR